MTALPTPPLSLSTRRLCVGLSAAGLLLLTFSLWGYVAAGSLDLNGWTPLQLLALVLTCGPLALLMRRFQPLPDYGRADERQARRHTEVYRLAFYITWGAASALALAYWVASLRGWSGPPVHPLTPAIPLSWLGFAGVLPALVYAWHEPDFG